MFNAPESDPLAATRTELDRHQATHRRNRLPERLWQCAAEFSRQRSVERVAFNLDLDESGLRRRMTAISRSASSDSATTARPTFVDALISSIMEPAPASSSSATASGFTEIECSRGPRSSDVEAHPISA